MNGDQRVADAVAAVSRPAAELYSQAEATRRQSRLLAARLQDARLTSAETLQLIDATWDRTARNRESWAAAATSILRYSVTARLQARLATMPVIEQAKGIVMAQCGWAADQAFDALRRASQRENIKMRDLAARIVTQAARSASADQQPGPALAAAPAAGEVSHAAIVSAIAGAATRRQERKAAG